MKTKALAAPGAGLPFPESIIAKLLLRLRIWIGNPQSFTARFSAEREKIRHLIGATEASTLAQRVLIKRLPGLEDSSRNWSILMTLDHLRIVNGDLTKVIRALSQEHVPEGKVSTAAVKPSPNVTAEVIAAYEASCDDFLLSLNSITNWKSQAKFPHPWFWAMDANAWHALAGVHMGIHRSQMERILKELA